MKIPRPRFTIDNVLFLIGFLGLTMAFGLQYFPDSATPHGWALGWALLRCLLIGVVGSLAFFLLLFLLIALGLLSISKPPRRRP